MSAGTSVPDRPDEAPSQRRRERRWWPVLAVVVTIGFVLVGARGVGDAVSRPLTVGGIVRVDPSPGWERTASRDDGNLHEVLLRRGAAGLYVAAIEGVGGTSADLAERYVREGLENEYVRVTVGEPEPAALAGGVPAVRFGYVGVNADGVTTEGVVVAAVGPRGGVIFDGFAPEGSLGADAADLAEMIEGASLT